MIKLSFNSKLAKVVGEVRKPKIHSVVGSPTLGCTNTMACETTTCQTACGC